MAVAHNKNVGYSPYKVRRIIDLIRSRSVNEAKIQLTSTRNSSGSGNFKNFEFCSC